ncbi:MAG: penicillin-binding protein 2 [Coriobacteriia bacterium]|nr:penicillin-binding protein 2 [Coriobacteriia bacterium]
MAQRRMRSSGSGRFAFLLVVLSSLFLVLVARLIFVQVIAAPTYAAKATAQRMRDIQLPALRGTIYDREGEALARSVAARTVYAAPNTVKDKSATAHSLASVLGGTPAYYEDKLSKNTGFVYIARQIDMDKADKLEALKLEGIGLLEDSKRVYPSGDLAAQTLGFMGIDGTGLAGIEKRYDSVLAGKPGVLLGERDPYGRPIPGGVQKNVDPVDGHDIVLTIDKDIQDHAQVELAAAIKKWGASGGSVTIMNPQDGEIYAMTSTPGFDPNNYQKADPKGFRSRPIQDAYEPGSTIKSITAASVIGAGIFTPNSMFHLPTSLKVAGFTIHDAEGRGTVDWSLTQIVTNSSNIGAAKMGMKLGKQGLYDSFQRFGLTEATGVDFPGEAKGWLPAPARWQNGSVASISFGQGLSVTPLQLARAVSAIANGGTLITPHFLLDVPQDPALKPVWPTRVACSHQTAVTTTNILKHVVTEGTGKAAAVPGYVVAGKTGTAQVALPNGLGYAKDKYISSFIGYLPADNPQLLIEVKLDEPSNAIFGGTVAAPSFSSLAAFCCDHLKIPPTSAQSVVTSGTPILGVDAPSVPAKLATTTKKAAAAKSGSSKPKSDDSSTGGGASSADDAGKNQ